MQVSSLLTLLTFLLFLSPSSAQEEIMDVDEITPRFSLRRSFGDDVGYQDGYTYLEAFVPVQQEPLCSLLFTNVRVVNYEDDEEFWEAQGGGGYRWLLDDWGVVAGVNAFYDGRNTDTRWYHQVGFGWELLGECWEARGNVYVPVGQQRNVLIDTTTIDSARFVGTNIAVDVTTRRLIESAMNGVDAEIGIKLPDFRDIRTRAYLGFYHYSNDGMQTANGIRGRLESWWRESVSVHVSVQNDAVFDTTVTGGIALHFGGVSRESRRMAPLAAKLGERVVRDPNIVISRNEQNETRTELAIDPSTGEPIEVRHVNSGVAPGGDGSVERPFNNLAALEAGSSGGQILFVQAGSVFAGEGGILLKVGQRLLGEGLPHLFTARQGTALLPTATGGTTLPLISNPGVVSAIVLADNTEVSGLRIDGALGRAIFGAASNVNVNNNIITNSRTAIFLQSPSSSAPETSVIANNNISNVERGILVLSGGTTNRTVSIIGNSVTDVTGADTVGIRVSASGETLRALINNNVVIVGGRNSDGIRITANGSAVGSYQVANNVTDNLSNPVDIFAQSTGMSTLNLQLFGNVSGRYSLRQLANSTFTVEETLGTNNVSEIIQFGSIGTAPFGTFGFPDPQ